MLIKENVELVVHKVNIKTIKKDHVNLAHTFHLIHSACKYVQMDIMVIK